MSAPPDELPGRTRPPVRPVRLALALVIVVVAALVLLPDLLGLDHRSPFAQLVSFRPAMVAGLLVLAVAAMVVAVIRKRGWTLPAGLLAVAAVGGAMVLPRALPAPDVPEPDAPAARTLTVLSFNTYEGQADVDAVAALIRSSRPDLIALPESAARYRDRLAPLRPGLPVHPVPRARPRRPGRHGGRARRPRRRRGAGRPQRRRSRPSRSPAAASATCGSSPSTRSRRPPATIPQWSSDLATLDRWCADRQAGPVIVAGDFNATLDHSVFRDGDDRVRRRGRADRRGPGGHLAEPFPRWLGPQIDHVLITGGITAETLSVHDIPGSDHRAVVTRLRLPT